MQTEIKTEDVLVMQLVKIEENIINLSIVLASQPLQRKEEIQSLMSEITSLAIRSREKIESGIISSQSYQSETDAVVTSKEIRELLEAFA